VQAKAIRAARHLIEQRPGAMGQPLVLGKGSTA
jgi:hypothetical protein